MRSIQSCAAILSFAIAIAIASASAQTPPPPTGTPNPTDKQAISKACSDQANAKGLHGKERKKFRAACKKRGGAPQ
jgi:invasion protein IalB